MFASGSHYDLKNSLETIGASFAIFEYRENVNDYVFISGNTLYEEILGQPASSCVEKDLKSLLPRYIEQVVREGLTLCRSEQKPKEREVVIEHKNEVRWWRFIFSPVTSESSSSRVINTCIEITEKKKLELELNRVRQRYEAVIENAYDGIITIDEDQKIKLMNNSAKYMFGVDQESVINASLNNFIPSRYRHRHKEYVNSFKNSVVDSRPMQSRAAVVGLRKDGTEFPIEVTISKISVGGRSEMTAVVRDISERAKLVEELRRAAQEDHLTQLFNRRHMQETLQTELARSRRFEHVTTVAMLDIDHFKEVNDTYGHECGDFILKSLAQLLSNNSRSIDSLSRWGGEEFLILLPETSAIEAKVWAEKIRLLVEQHIFQYGDQDIQITLSIGIGSIEANEGSVDVLVNIADQNMYTSKRNGRNMVTG